MRTLFLAWQAPNSRSWYPIGRLDADLSKPRFRFGYTKGARVAKKESSLEPLDAFPNLYATYESSQLFPLFRNRVLSKDRKDFLDYLHQLDLRPDQSDPIEILSVSGGTRLTDSLEVFPKVEARKDGGFECRFFLHGWRHVSEAARQKLMRLQPNDRLQVAIELNNPATAHALLILTTDDYHMVGWAPRYLVGDLFKALSESPEQVNARVVRVNPEPAPANQRVLVELTGHWPTNYKPMDSEQFQLLAK